jgi:hypothetical protein
MKKGNRKKINIKRRLVFKNNKEKAKKRAIIAMIQQCFGLLLGQILNDLKLLSSLHLCLFQAVFVNI